MVGFDKAGRIVGSQPLPRLPPHKGRICGLPQVKFPLLTYTILKGFVVRAGPFSVHGRWQAAPSDQLQLEQLRSQNQRCVNGTA